MANLNNPAGRLLYWLELGKQRNMGSSAMGEWCVVFGLNHELPADRSECTRRGTMLAMLARTARREAERLPEMFHPGVMLAHFHEVETALDHFTILPSIALQQMFDQITGTGWQSLTMLDAILSTQRPEQVIEHSAIREHIERVRELIEEVLADDGLDEVLKTYIVARLRDIEDALTDSLITGVSAVERAANVTLGAAQLDHDWWDRIAQTKWAPRIGAVWMGIVTTLGAAGGVPALMPADDSHTPAIVQTVDVDTKVNVNVPADGDADVVHDAEIVEDDQDRPHGAFR